MIKSKKLKNRYYVIVSTVVLILLWKVIALIVGKSIIIPSPEETFSALIRIISSEYFIMQVLNTMKRVIIGFLISFSSGLFFGILAGLIEPIFYLLKPLILLQKSVPTMVIILLAIIWNNELAPIFVGVLVIFPMIYTSVLSGIKNIDPKLMEMSKVYQLSEKKRLRHIYIPSISGALWAILSVAVGLNIKIIIAAEVLSQPNMAMGTEFIIEKSTLNTAGVFAWAAVAIAMAAFFDWALSLARQRISKQ